MTQKERIEVLEREISDLRMLVASLQSQLAFRPVAPTLIPKPWPSRPPYQPLFPPVYHNVVAA